MRTKIWVFHKTRLVTACGICLLLILLFFFLFFLLPREKQNASPDKSLPTASDCIFLPGTYSTSLSLGSQNLQVEVAVDQTAVTDIHLIYPDETVSAMLPLLEPTIQTICEQVKQGTSLDQISYSSDNKYTALVLLEAVKNALDRAKIAP